MKKLKAGIIGNTISYVILALFTVILYSLITKKYGKEELGAYNIIMSFYTLSGHIGVWGLQSAAIFFVAQAESEEKKISGIFSSALTLVFSISSIVAIILSVFSNFIGNKIYLSQYVAFGMKVISPAIILFSINKLILGYLNGYQEMIQYAILQGLRYFVIVITVIVVSLLDMEFNVTLYSFGIAEIAVLLVGSLCLKKYITISIPNKNDVFKNLSFGSKSVFGNVLEDFNTRIDVMMLGALASDKIVGLYSFISLLVEGVFKLLYVVRSNMNPIFAELFHSKKQEELSVLYKKIKCVLSVGTFCLGLFLVTGYWGFCNIFLDKEYIETVVAFVIIIMGMTILAPFFVCGNVCTQSGKPLQDSLVTLTTIIVNIITNYFLIIKYGLYGAAMATSISYIIYSILMKKAIEYRINNITEKF